MDPAKDDILVPIPMPLKDLVSPEMWEEHYTDLEPIPGSLRMQPGPDHPNHGKNYEPICPINGGAPVEA